jgi:hypothetical protein
MTSVKTGLARNCQQKTRQATRAGAPVQFRGCSQFSVK